MERGNHEQLLATKLAIPPTYYRRYVSRARLTDRLEAALFPLTLITAPAGFGKTTLVSQWLRPHQSKVAWISLDSSDDTPQKFWLYVLNALKKYEALKLEDTVFIKTS